MRDNEKEGVDRRVAFFCGGMFGVGARLTLLPEKNTACVVLTNASTDMQGTEFWEVEWEILKVVVPGFPEAPDRRSASRTGSSSSAGNRG